MPTHTIHTTPALVEHLRWLRAERALITAAGRGDELADLDAAIAGCRRAYVSAAVTDIATLRAELSGALQG